MWMLILITFVNAVLHQQGIQNVYRLNIGIIQLGIIDVVMGMGILYALVFGSNIRGQFPTLRSHPTVVWIVGMMFVGTFFGLLMGVVNGSMPKFFLSSAREFVAVPLCFLVGYRLVGTPKNVRTIARFMLIAGACTATMLFWSFGEKTEEAALKGHLNMVRGIISHYNADYASVAALALVFVVMTRVPLWRTAVCVVLGIYCYIGYAATLSRIGFLILFLGTVASYLLLPKGERTRKFIRSVVFIPVLFFACWGALWVGDQLIGRNFSGKVGKHVESLLPGERTGSDEKAWDSRLGGITAELAIWLRNPLMGQGFGTGETQFLSGRVSGGYVSIKHNSFTSTLAETGMFGFAGLMMLLGAMMLVGFRMVHDRTSPDYVLIGALGFFGGVVFFLRCAATMGITSRAAIGFGIVGGALIRAREIQETEVAMAQQGAYDMPYVDEHSGLLVPDYGYDLGHFGAN
jgi:hypothetical protein